ncbi:hypothetical protein HY439_00135 [Candidatus Microgenomates bacterium]|nr:hypothetical protein [Candidatus Microgenomates bacterium]
MSKEAPVITATAKLEDGHEWTTQVSDGKPYREGAVSQLGKRYKCANPFTRIREGIEVTELKGGIRKTSAGEINFGCETQILCTKKSSVKDPQDQEGGRPYCCDMPMSLENPKPLPSSD